MFKGFLFTLVACGMLSAGCLARGGAAGMSRDVSDDDPDNFGSLPVTSSSTQQPQSAQPGGMEVAWEDNGIPIRQLTGTGAPQEMKLPSSHPKAPKQK